MHLCPPGACRPAVIHTHPPTLRPRRLARPRTPPFHGDNTGSNPVGDANQFNKLEVEGNSSASAGERSKLALISPQTLSMTASPEIITPPPFQAADRISVSRGETASVNRAGDQSRRVRWAPLFAGYSSTHGRAPAANTSVRAGIAAIPAPAPSDHRLVQPYCIHFAARPRRETRNFGTSRPGGEPSLPRQNSPDCA